MAKEYSLVGCCGMSCAICPRYHVSGKSKCNGCGEKAQCSQYCATYKCAVIKKGLESCAQCEESPCAKVKNLAEWKGFDTGRIWLKHLEKIKAVGIEKWNDEQLEKRNLIEIALKEFNDGRSKGFICLAFLTIDSVSLKNVIDKAIEEYKDIEIKEKAKMFRELLKKTAQEHGVVIDKTNILP